MSLIVCVCLVEHGNDSRPFIIKDGSRKRKISEKIRLPYLYSVRLLDHIA